MRLVLVLSLALCTPLLFADDVEDRCGKHTNLLRDSAGQLIWKSSEEMRSLLVTEVPAQKPPLTNLAYQGVVSFNIMVSTSGSVLCMWNAAGHPMMIPYAARALHEWKFKSLTSNDKPVEYVGKVKVPVSSR